MTTAATPPIQIKLPRPHSEGQKALALSQTNDVCFAGRRWGKTQVGVYRILRGATHQVGLYWWVGLSWRSASMKRAWRLLKYYIRRIWQAVGQSHEVHIRESVKELDLPNGSQIWLRTAERQDSLAGEAIRGAVVDEFTLMGETVWTEYLEATLLDYQGWALFIGVPKGDNWAARLWANAKNRPKWRQWQFTTLDNPRMSPESVADIRANVPEALFNQEYLAIIIEGAGAVFRNYRACIHPMADRALGPVVMGVDWGKQNDYTVIIAIDTYTRRVIALDRFNTIDWPLQRGRLTTMIQRYKPIKVLAEENSMGGPNISDLQLEGLPVYPFNTNNASKTQIINELALAFEQGSIGIPDNPILLAELGAFAMERLPSGLWRYSAPNGLHDDMVIALALANHALSSAPLRYGERARPDFYDDDIDLDTGQRM